MKALSLWQPWASLVAHGVKRIETRGRMFNHRGPLLIHAAKHWSIEQFSAMSNGPLNYACQQLNQHLRSVKNFTEWQAVPEDYGLPLGAIVGIVDVVGCRPTGELTIYDIGRLPGVRYCEMDLGDFTLGRYAIQLATDAAFPEPISWKGKQGMFEVRAHDHPQLVAAIALVGRDATGGIGIARPAAGPYWPAAHSAVPGETPRAARAAAVPAFAACPAAAVLVPLRPHQRMVAVFAGRTADFGWPGGLGIVLGAACGFWGRHSAAAPPPPRSLWAASVTGLVWVV